ncbi:MAG: MFS transporter [Mesorhizobium sp.]
MGQSTGRTAAFALLLGNFVIGLSIVGPAGMVDPLAADFGIAVASAAFLITGGAVVLCIGSPLVAWGTSTIDRRLLLSATMAVLAVCHVASALAPSYGALLAIRVVAMAFAAIFTPQAASAIAMLVPERERPGAISFVFLGWSLAAAAGLPLVAYVAAEHGWRMVHWGLALCASVAAVAVFASLPQKLRGISISLANWGSLFRNPFVLILLAATILGGAGQFIIFTFFGPLLARTVQASSSEIAICFAVFGVAGFLGNVAASRVVGRIGALNTSLIFFGAMLAGAVLWALSTGSVLLALIASGVWGIGFAASNSMQQARLAGAAPALAGAAIALNSSSIYIGQAVGSGLGGVLFEQAHYGAMAWVGAGLLAVTLALVYLSGRLERA